MSLLKVSDLTLAHKEKKILRGISLTVEKEKHLGLVGESGAGKSFLAKLIFGLIPDDPLFNYSGKISYKGIDLPLMDENKYRPLRMKKIAIAFQDPSAHLDPLFTVKSHFKEIYRYHLRGKISIVDWFNQNTEILGKLGLDNPEIVMSQYPFQLSGGQSQLILLALSLSCHPRLIIADEISSSLDIGQQVNLVEFLLSHLKEIESTMILISHDLRLVSHFTNYVMVMFQGLDIEYGKTEELIMNPLHPYTASLVKVAGYLSLGNENISTTEPLTTPTPPYSGNGGCLYYRRCEKRNKYCLKNSPPRIHINSKRWVRCFLYE